MNYKISSIHRLRNLRRIFTKKSLGERPFNASNGGSPKEEIAEPPKSMQVDTTTRGIGDPLEDFKEKADL